MAPSVVQTRKILPALELVRYAKYIRFCHSIIAMDALGSTAYESTLGQPVVPVNVEPLLVAKVSLK